MKIFRPANIFTGLAVALAFAFVFRLINVATFQGQGSGDDIGLTRPANAGGFSPQQLHSPPPPAESDAPSQADLDKKVQDSAHAPDDAASAAAAPSAAPVPVKDANKDDALPPPPDGNASFSASEVEVLQSLSKRRDELDKREKSLAEREALLSAAEQEVDHKITELNKLKGELENLLGQQQTEQDERITSLVKIYEEMKPKEAATIFNTLDMDVLMAVIGRMSEKDQRKVGPILAAMDPDKARLVTIRLMQQRELPAAAAIKKEAQQQGLAAPAH